MCILLAGYSDIHGIESLMVAWRPYNFAKDCNSQLATCFAKAQAQCFLRAPWSVAMALCLAAFEAVTETCMLPGSHLQEESKRISCLLHT